MPFVLPMLSTVIVFSVLFLGAVVVNQQRQLNKKFAVPAPSQSPSIQDVLCDCKLRELCETGINSGRMGMGIEAQSCGNGKICCPIKIDSNPKMNISSESGGSKTNRTGSDANSIPDLDFPYSPDGDEAKKEGIILKANSSEPENVDFDYEDESGRAVSPKFRKVEQLAENQVSLNDHENFKLLPSWKECGITGVASEKNKEQVSFDDYPWIVQIGFKSVSGEVQYKCTGSLINQKYVLAAAHCNQNGLPSEVLIKVSHGSTDDNKFARFEIKKSIQHPLYRNDALGNDIALFRLSVPANLKLKFQPTCLTFSNEHEFPAEDSADSRLVGFSTDTSNDAVSITQNIQEFPVRIVPKSECDAILLLRNSSNSNGNQLCLQLTPKSGSDHCKTEGIEGSLYSVMDEKLPKKYVHVGISSMPVKCAGNTAGVFTRVSKYLDWILDSIEA